MLGDASSTESGASLANELLTRLLVDLTSCLLLADSDMESRGDGTMSAFVDRLVETPDVFAAAVESAALLFREPSLTPCADNGMGAGRATLPLFSERDKRITRSTPSSIRVAIAHTAEKAKDYSIWLGVRGVGGRKDQISVADQLSSVRNAPKRSPSPIY